MQLIVVSKFILAIRRSDQRNRAVESRFSQFAGSGLEIPTFAGDMGQLLDHGSLESEEPKKENSRDGNEGSFAGTRLRLDHLSMDSKAPASATGSTSSEGSEVRPRP